MPRSRHNTAKRMLKAMSKKITTILRPNENFAELDRVATVREKVLENEKFSRSGKSQGITFSVREI